MREDPTELDAFRDRMRFGRDPRGPIDMGRAAATDLRKGRPHPAVPDHIVRDQEPPTGRHPLSERILVPLTHGHHLLRLGNDEHLTDVKRGPEEIPDKERQKISDALERSRDAGASVSLSVDSDAQPLARHLRRTVSRPLGFQRGGGQDAEDGTPNRKEVLAFALHAHSPSDRQAVAPRIEAKTQSLGAFPALGQSSERRDALPV